MLKPTFNETLTAKLYKAKKNEIGVWSKQPIQFNYRYLEKKEKSMYKPLKGVISEESRVFIASTNLPLEINIGDKIELFDGDYMIVESFGILYDQQSIINMGKFSPEWINKRLSKAISLKN